MRCFLSLLLLLSLLVTPVLAHPGRTDSNGGHYDRSTGEYHYHHGYSAHQHYDMDGDGILDCPYNFRDATDHSSSSSTTRSTTNPPSTTSDYDEWNAKMEKSKAGDRAIEVVKVIFTIIALIWIVLKFTLG